MKPDEVTVSLNLRFGPGGISGKWAPDEAERKAAWEMYVELVTTAFVGLRRMGNLAPRRSAVPEHRRRIRVALVALVGWLVHWPADREPMGTLVQRLELAPGDKEEAA